MNRQKRFAPKVRTGCSTCKNRHIKCDETKPRCKQCTSSGRECGGYEFVAKTSTKKKKTSAANEIDLTLSSIPKQLPEGLADGQGVFLQRYFQLVCTFQFMHSDDVLLSRGLAKSKLPTAEAQSMNRQFWFEILPEASVTQPAVNQAIQAYTALHSSQRVGDHPNRELFRAEAIKHRNNAFQIVGTSNSASTILDTLISCVFFASYEFASGNLAGGACHMTAGMKIIGEIEANNALPPLQMTLIRQYLLPIISDFDISTSMNDERSENDPLVCHDGLTALDRIAKKWSSIARIAKYLDWTLNTASPASSKLDLIKDIKADITSWSITLDLLEMDMGLTLTTFNLFRFLQAYRRLIIVMLFSFPFQDECCFDEYEPLFCSLMLNFRALFEIMPQAPIMAIAQKRLLQTEVFHQMWLIPPLFQTATRCRISQLRWDAVRILRRLDRVEGDWNSDIAAHIAAALITMEEDGNNEAGKPGLIPEEERIRLHSVCRVSNSSTRVHMFYKRYPYDIVTPAHVKEVELPQSAFTPEVQWPLSKVLFGASYEDGHDGVESICNVALPFLFPTEESG